MTLQSPSAPWHALAGTLTLRTRAFIDGRYQDAQSGATYANINPATGQELVQVTAGGEADIDAAVRAARRAFEDGRWRDQSPAARKRVLLRFAELIEAHLEELALLDTLNMGMPIRDSYGLFVPKAANMMRWYAEAIDKLYDEIAPTARDVLALVTREPLGVVGAVIPWNIPLYLAAYKLGPALATGNSVVLKPAEQSPLSALRVAELASEAGLPDGVLNVVPGDGIHAGAALGRHMDVDVLTFTGSTQVAKIYLHYAAESNMKRVQLEAGGKSPHIVMADAPDLDEVASQAAWGVFFNQGQICSAGSRLLVHERVRDDLLERVMRVAQSMRVGDPLDPETQLGAVVDERQMLRVLGYIDQGHQQGARLALGGARVLTETGGYYVEPTIFDNVHNDMVIAREEVFGPLLSVIAFKDADDAVRIGNDTMYGLGAAVWSRDINTALNTAKALRVGQVWVNNYDASDITVPWGGFKQSGNGRDKSLHAMEEYTALKATWIQLR